MEKAVVGYAEGAVKGLIGKLGSVLADEALLLGGVRGEIQYIKDELESMTAFLVVQAQKEEDPDHQVKIWMKQVREMAYDAEDCIDKFRCRIDKPREKGLRGIIQKSALVLRTLNARHQLAIEIQDLKRRTHEASERKQRYHAPASDASRITSHANDSMIPYPQLSALYPEQVHPVGFDGHRDQIIGWLTEENRPRLTVISIVGFGGLGKTTLAKMAYESSAVKAANFQCRAFVSVSQRFDIKLLLADILQQIFLFSNKGSASQTNDQETKEQKAARKFYENIENWNQHKYVSKLQEYLNSKRYLIILDDIWAISAWEQFKIALPNCRNGSRIIVTTRIESVANECSSDEEPYVFNMKPLDPQASKMLFNNRIFGVDDHLPSPELEQVSIDILKKCGGMPLAINSVAGLLTSKPKQPDQWRTILNSLGSELETNPTLEGMRKILFLSYQNLPHYLKTCFLYLSIYPEDYEIRRKGLMTRWIHEGFVSIKRGLRAEEVAESYFYELLNRNMVIPIDISLSGEIKSIRVHDIMLEIIVSKSLEENFVSLVGDEYDLTYDKIRRLSVHSIGQNNLVSNINMNLSHVRSLTVFGTLSKWVKSKQLKLVRVLDLEGTNGLENGHLKYLCNMSQLRYLSLRGTNVSILPSKIKKLQSLEKLDLRNTWIRKLPPGIVKLQNLSYVYAGYRFEYSFFNTIAGYPLLIPRGVQNMKSLRILTLINCSRMDELGELSQIKKLGVQFEYGESAIVRLKPFFSALDKLSLSLRSLKISKARRFMTILSLTSFLNSLESPPILLKSLQLECSLENLPHWFPSLSNLTKLKLLTTRTLDDKDFQILQELPNLIILHQCYYDFNVDELVFNEKGFPSLRVFTYETNITPVLKFREGAASKLQKLALGFRLDPTTLDLHGIKQLQSLNEVVLKFQEKSNSATIITGLQDVINSGPNKFKLTVEYYTNIGVPDNDM